MPLAQRQSEAAPPSPLQWFTVEEAAARLNLSTRDVARKCDLYWQRAGRAQKRRPEDGGKERWYICETADPRLLLPEGGEEELKASLYTKYPRHRVDRAFKRKYALDRWCDMCDGRTEPPDALRIQRKRPTAIQLAKAEVAAQRESDPDFKISVRSLQAWRKDYADFGIEGLVSDYGGGGSDDGSTEDRSVEAINYFYSIFRTQLKYSIKTSHLTTLHWAKENGYSWPASLSATRAWLKKYDEKDKTCHAREGRTAYSRKFMPHLSIDWSTCEPGFFYTTDHTECDFHCVDDDGQTFRPWLTTFVDARSRKIVGWHLGESPHQDAIVVAAGMAFRQAVPQKMRIDNGKDFTSKLLTGVTKKERDSYRRELGADWQQKLAHDYDVHWHGVFGELGIKLIYAKKFNAWAKALMERWYGTFQDWCSRTMITYTGNRPEHRPECSEELRKGPDVPTLAYARQRVAEVIELYHLSPHSGIDNQSPQSVWQTATKLRKAGDAQLVALMQGRGTYTVRATGVTFRIAGKSWSYGAGNPLLGRYLGREVFITVDHARTEFCLAWTPDRGSRVLIGRLESNEPLPADTTIDQLRKAMKIVGARDRELRRMETHAPDLARSAAHEVVEMQRAQIKELRKTGTDDVDIQPNIEVVRTSFEGATKPVQTATAPPRRQRIDFRKMAETSPAATEKPKRSLWNQLRQKAQEERG